MHASTISHCKRVSASINQLLNTSSVLVLRTVHLSSYGMNEITVFCLRNSVGDGYGTSSLPFIQRGPGTEGPRELNIPGTYCTVFLEPNVRYNFLRSLLLTKVHKYLYMIQPLHHVTIVNVFNKKIAFNSDYV